MLIFYYVIILVNFEVSCERIYSNSYEILSPSKIHHDLPNLFDSNLGSSSNIYIHSNGTFSLAIELKEESLVDYVFIHGILLILNLSFIFFKSFLADQNKQLEHEIRVGYIRNYERSSIKYKCKKAENGIICKFPCTFGDSSIPIAGKYIFWSVRQNARASWVGINEISIEGTSIKYDKKGYLLFIINIIILS